MDLSLTQLLAEAARRWGSRVAIRDGDRSLRYEELWDLALRYAEGLRRAGARAGDRVAMVLPNGAAFPAVYFAIVALGAAVVPVNIRLAPAEIRAILTAAHADLVIATGSTQAMTTAAARGASCRVLVVDAPHAQPADQLAPGPVRLTDIARAGADDIAVVMYTSGTTGAPKGAMLTHGNLVLNALITARDVCSYTPRDVVLGALPLAHSFGQTVVMNAGLSAGATIVVLDHFTAGEALRLMEHHEVTVFSGVPTMYNALLDAARLRPAPPRLRLATSGGASLPTAVIDEFADLFGTDIHEGYGLTETSPAATFNQSAYGRRPGSIGHPIWGLDVEIADPAVTDRVALLPPGEVGELVVRGHAVFAGYLDDAEATAEALHDGWLRTGDLGTTDDDGFISIVGRKKELIIRGGYNVYPREVEDVIGQHPAIAQVAVIGHPHPYHGEEVVACVVLRTPVEPSTIITWARERLAVYKCPTRIHAMSELPTGPSGKIHKRELADSIAALDPQPLDRTDLT